MGAGAQRASRLVSDKERANHISYTIAVAFTLKGGGNRPFGVYHDESGPGHRPVSAPGEQLGVIQYWMDEVMSTHGSSECARGCLMGKFG